MPDHPRLIKRSNKHDLGLTAVSCKATLPEQLPPCVLYHDTFRSTIQHYNPIFVCSAWQKATRQLQGTWLLGLSSTSLWSVPYTTSIKGAMHESRSTHRDHLSAMYIKQRTLITNEEQLAVLNTAAIGWQKFTPSTHKKDYSHLFWVAVDMQGKQLMPSWQTWAVGHQHTLQS